jgi:hypothetical protein
VINNGRDEDSHFDRLLEDAEQRMANVKVWVDTTANNNTDSGGGGDTPA